MEVVISGNCIGVLEKNRIIGAPSISNSMIIFRGSGNFLYCEEGVELENSRINFNGDNSIIYLSKSSHKYYLNFSLGQNCSFYVGRDNYFSGILNGVISEGKNIFIGDHGLFSFDIWIRTSDAHLVYSIASNNRINYSNSIVIGDHVWLGQHCYISKGTFIGSGSIIGAMSVVAGKKIPSNCSYAGNPARKISSNIFFLNDSTMKFSDLHIEKFSKSSTTRFVYHDDGKSLNVDELNFLLSSMGLAEDKFKFLKRNLSNSNNKNRFFLKNSKEVE